MTNSLERSLETPTTSWTRGALLRLGFVYWGLYCILIAFTNTRGLSWLPGAYSRVFGDIGVWVGKTILRIPYEFSGAPNGSGDKTANWAMMFLIALIAVVATVVWSLVDRRRAHDAKLREAIRIAVRYTLAFTVLGYGIGKVFLGQFSPPTGGRLLQRIGEVSPMGMLWTFMGSSPVYVFFSGAMETLGAGLLLFRRTTTLGALVLVVVMSNIVMLNFCYDVPVKLASTHYLAMAIYLLLPEARRLASVIVLDRAVPPVSRTLVLPKRWMRVARLVLKYGMIAAVVFIITRGSVSSYLDRSTTPKTWHDGEWVVTSYVGNGRELPDQPSETTRWMRIRFLRFSDKLWLRWKTPGSDSGDFYTCVLDEAAHTLRLTYDKDSNPSKQARPGFDVITLRYTLPDATHLTLEGKIGEEQVQQKLERFDGSGMLLVTRGFRLISEAPFNR